MLTFRRPSNKYPQKLLDICMYVNKFIFLSCLKNKQKKKWKKKINENSQGKTMGTEYLFVI